VLPLLGTYYKQPVVPKRMAQVKASACTDPRSSTPAERLRCLRCVYLLQGLQLQRSSESEYETRTGDQFARRKRDFDYQVAVISISKSNSPPNNQTCHFPPEGDGPHSPPDIPLKHNTPSSHRLSTLPFPFSHPPPSSHSSN